MVLVGGGEAHLLLEGIDLSAGAHLMTRAGGEHNEGTIVRT